ncbi:MAG: hypothetical protein K2L69_05215 [Muribaculaceae bacterium]|nr:hypothetical protein [Muribaculaceae bacterium]
MNSVENRRPETGFRNSTVPPDFAFDIITVVTMLIVEFAGTSTVSVTSLLAELYISLDDNNKYLSSPIHHRPLV